MQYSVKKYIYIFVKWLRPSAQNYYLLNERHLRQTAYFSLMKYKNRNLFVRGTLWDEERRV